MRLPLGKRLVKAYFDWLAETRFSNPVAFTFTMRRVESGQWIDKLSAQRNFRHFLNLLNVRIFGNAARRYGRRLKVIASLESMADGRLHYHGLIDRPDRASVADFRSIISECWARTRWAYKEIDIQEAADAGWLRYMLKVRSKLEPDELIDVGNTHTR